MMKNLWGRQIRVVITLAIMVAMTSQAVAADVNVIRQGFCVSRGQSGCSEVALPDTMVDFNRLPQGPGDARLLYFYSAQKVTAKTTLVHLLTATDADPKVTYVIGDNLSAQAKTLKTALQSMLRKNPPDGAVVVTPFQITVSDQQSVVISSIAVTGPGTYQGGVVDLAGSPLPGSERISVTVTQTQ